MDKHDHDYLVWIDLEMTGLDPRQDCIIEIASIVTTDRLVTVAEGPSLCINQPQEALAVMSSYVRDMHTKSGLLALVAQSPITLKQAEENTLDYIRMYCEPKKAPLCGNSVWQDRVFLQTYMPRLHDYLHYRTIDVTSFKEVIRRWYPNNPAAHIKKNDGHRALDDIRESIHELRHYRDFFFIQDPTKIHTQ